MFLDYFTYVLVLVLTIFSIYLVVAKRDFIKTHRNIIFYFFIGILVYSTYARHISELFTTNPVFTIKDIPMNYCRWTALLIVAYSFTKKNKYLAQFIYFQAGLGFFSIVLPGGDFFILTESHRNLGYLFDHYMIALMTVFIIYIDGIKISKRFMYIGMIYSLIVPFSLLPYALSTGHNVYYILDGAIISMVVGNNQVIISILYIIGMTLYYFLMYQLSIKMTKHAETKGSNNIFRPVYPWIILGVYVIAGLFVTHVVIDTTPKDITKYVDTYEKTPVKTLDGFGYVYETTKDGETLYFIQITKKYEEVEVLTTSGIMIEVMTEGDVFYFEDEDTLDETVIIILYKNRGEDNEKIKTYPLT